MNYKLHYIRLIERALLRELPIGIYTENHHITPRCMNGSNEKNNLVKLTAEEHFVAHQLLVKIFPEHSGLVFALRQLLRTSDGQARNNKEYAWIKRKLAIAQSKRMKGNKNALGNTFFLSSEAREHLINNEHALGSKWNHTAEVCSSLSVRNRGNKYAVGTFWVTNGTDSKLMKAGSNIPLGWKKGRIRKLIKAQKNSNTKLLGVSFHKNSGKYQAHITVQGRVKYLGLFTTAKLAHIARTKAEHNLY